MNLLGTERLINAVLPVSRGLFRSVHVSWRSIAKRTRTKRVMHGKSIIPASFYQCFPSVTQPKRIWIHLNTFTILFNITSRYARVTRRRFELRTRCVWRATSPIARVPSRFIFFSLFRRIFACLRRDADARYRIHDIDLVGPASASSAFAYDKGEREFLLRHIRAPCI